MKKNSKSQEQKAKSAEKAKSREKTKVIGSAKGVETLFRNAYRAELDLLALAATKANIMISLNGFIISALMISGAFILASSPGFLIPAGVFMITAAISIVFALLAASPEQVDLPGALLGWYRAYRNGEAKLRDLKAYVMRGPNSTEKNELNLLIYEDRIKLNPKEYWQHMQDLLRDQKNVYHRMSDKLYWLGKMSNRKFKLLNISYITFRWGLLASLVAFIGVRSVGGIFTVEPNQVTGNSNNFGISELSDIYEPSAIQQLPDGRILVVEDEALRSISVLSVAHDGRLVENTATDLKLIRNFGRKLNDLEGLSSDNDGFIYAITSHSLTKKGKSQPSRNQLLRFKIKGNNVTDINVYEQLRDVLQQADELKDAIEHETGKRIDFNELNIEGLAYSTDDGTLKLGLRGPIAGGKSIILVIENPAQVFTENVPPVFGEPILLELEGGGIRGLSYNSILGAYLIANEIKNEGGSKTSQLWTWSGYRDDEPVPINLPGIINLNNVESIDSVVINDEPRLLLMSDDGNAKKGRPAKYLLLDYTQLIGLRELDETSISLHN